MDVAARTATDLDLSPDLEAYDLTVSTATMAAMADLETGLHEAVRDVPAGGLLGIAAFGNLDEVEPLAYYVGAITAVAPDLVPPLTPGVFRLADPTTFDRRLRQVGLTEVRVRTTSRWLRFDSARHLLRAVTPIDSVAAHRLETLTPPQASDVERVIDGMFRERSGTRGAALRTVVNVGRGRIGVQTGT